MKNKKLNYIIILIALVLAAFISQKEPAPMPDSLRLTFVDVGQGDSAFICTPEGETWLIDGGEDGQYQSGLLPYLEARGVEQLDYVVATHYHNDHIGGIFQLLKSGKIKTLILPDYTPDSKAKNGLLKAAENAHTLVLDVSEGDILPSGNKDLKISVLHPEDGGFSPDNENSNSLVLKLEYFGTTALLTGDIEEDAEPLLTEKYDLEADILKLGHHGSATSTSDEFFKEVDPVYGIISAGQGNRYGHPHYEVLNRLRDDDVIIYRTDEDGDITFFLSEKGIDSIETETHYSKE